MEYYVDNTVLTSGDGTSWQQAWTSFAEIDWAAVQPGDTIYISGGADSQTYNETLAVGTSGAAGAPVTITKGADPGRDGTAIIDGGNSRIGVSVEDLDHVVVSGLVVRNIADAGFVVKQANAGVVLEGNSVYSGDPGDGNARGYDVRNSAGADAVVVRNNSYSTPASTAAQTDGIWSSDNNGIVFEDNRIVISNSDTTGHSDGFQSFHDYNVTVRGNWFEQANAAAVDNHGAWMSDTRTGGTVTFHDNIVLTPSLTDDAAVAHVMSDSWTETGTATIFNNTIVGGNPPIRLYNSPQAEVYNNTFPTEASVLAAPPEPAEAPAEQQQQATDWDMLAAQVLANYEATGRWFIC